MYIKHGSPVEMMEAYITVLTKGVCPSDENGPFLIKDYDVRKAYLTGSVKGKTWRVIGLVSVTSSLSTFVGLPLTERCLIQETNDDPSSSVLGHCRTTWF